jgi:hypothetical protein
MYPYILLTSPPTPDYPEYGGLLAEARRTLPAFVDPTDVDPSREVIARRGQDWATAVLGIPYDVFRTVTRVQGRLLQLADTAGVDPPLPEWIVEARTEGTRRAAEREQRYADQRARNTDAWAAVLAVATVELEVRESGHARVQRGGMYEPLRHAVPAVDVYSGVRRLRTHRAGRALCETEDRAHPLDLADTTTKPATCKACLGKAPHVRLTPRPSPTAPEGPR